MKDLKKCTEEYNELWNSLYDENTTDCLIELGVIDSDFTVETLVSIVASELEYNYSDPAWREDEDIAEFNQAKRKLEAFIKKWN